MDPLSQDGAIEGTAHVLSHLEGEGEEKGREKRGEGREGKRGIFRKQLKKSGAPSPAPGRDCTARLTPRCRAQSWARRQPSRRDQKALAEGEEPEGEEPHPSVRGSGAAVHDRCARSQLREHRESAIAQRHGVPQRLPIARPTAPSEPPGRGAAGAVDSRRCATNGP